MKLNRPAMKPISVAPTPATLKASDIRSYESREINIPALRARKKALTHRLGIIFNPNHAEITTGIMATKDQKVASNRVPPELDVMSIESKANSSNDHCVGSGAYWYN